MDRDALNGAKYELRQADTCLHICGLLDSRKGEFPLPRSMLSLDLIRRGNIRRQGFDHKAPRSDFH